MPGRRWCSLRIMWFLRPSAYQLAARSGTWTLSLVEAIGHIGQTDGLAANARRLNQLLTNNRTGR